MRYIGIVLMASAVTAGGFLCAATLKTRLEIMMIIQRMIGDLKTRILYTNDALPEALLEVGTQHLNRYDGVCKEPARMFISISGKLGEEPGRPYPEVWSEGVITMSAHVPISKHDRKMLLDLGSSLGYADREMQERTLQFYLKQAEESIAAIKQEMAEKESLYRSLGVAGGLFLVIFFI